MPDLVVQSFGGGLNFAQHPAFIRDDEWSWSQNFIAKDGAAEVARQFTSVNSDIDASLGTVSVIGAIQYPFDRSIVLVGLESGGDFFLYKMDAGTPAGATELTTGARAKASTTATMRGGVLNGVLVLCGGRTSGATDSSVIKVSGTVPTTYTTIVPASGALAANYLQSFSGHIILGGVNREGGLAYIEGRRVAWSDAQDPDLWVPALSNSADDVVLDDLESYITGLEQIGNNTMGVFTRSRISALIPTTRIPAYTRQPAVAGIGAVSLQDRSVAVTAELALGQTPHGVAFASDSRLYLLQPGAGLRDIGAKIADYWFKNVTNDSGSVLAATRPVCWHPGWRQIIFPVPDQRELMMYDPLSKAWSRLTLNDLILGGITSDIDRMAVIGGAAGARGDLWLMQGFVASAGEVYQEQLPTVALTDDKAFVDTKDFHVGHTIIYVDSILVDWEPLTNAGTDAIEIFAHSRDNFARVTTGILGSEGREMSTLAFTSVGTLTAGKSVLKVRRHGRYHRFRFQNASGRLRIRGLTLMLGPGGDRGEPNN